MQHQFTPLSEATDVKIVKQGASLKEMCLGVTDRSPLGYQHFGRLWEAFVVQFVAEHSSPNSQK